MFRWACSASLVKSIPVVQVWCIVHLHMIIVPDPPVRGRRRGFPPHTCTKPQLTLAIHIYHIILQLLKHLWSKPTLIEHYLILHISQTCEEVLWKGQFKRLNVCTHDFFHNFLTAIKCIWDWKCMTEILLLKKTPKRKSTNLLHWKRE